jgi:endonuclease/exonuclease/phosphatase (EEP) superfamily protein YafD
MSLPGPAAALAVWRWLARAAVLGSVVPAVLLSVGFSARLGDVWWLELLRYVPYPVFLLPAVLALALSFALGRRWRFAAALALGLVLTVIMGLAVGWADAGSVRVRVMTYNVKAWLAEHQNGGFAALAWEVALQDPDILVMQDAGELSAAHDENPQTASPVFAGRQVYAAGQYIVASRFPLRACHVAQIPYGGEEHTYVRCIVTPRGIDVDLVTAHLKSPRDGLNATRHERLEGLDDWRRNFSHRLTQATRLAADVSVRQRPLILAGDLNAPESSPVVQRLLDHGLRDAFSSAGRGYGYTHGHSLKPHISFLRIDHILVSREIGVYDSFTGGKDASEHRPVISDLLLQREPG